MADRDRSRSPHMSPLPYDEIVRLVVMREQARLAKDWSLADTIRGKLTDGGVTLFDKTNAWRSSDGQSGRIPTWSEIEAGQTPESIMAGQVDPFASNMGYEEAKSAAAMGLGDGSEGHIKHLVLMREQARAQKDWGQSDKLRDDLKALGVEVFDKEKMWRAKSGSSGVIIGYRGNAGPTDLEISTLVVQRERARQSSDYATSDMIRDELKAVGVEINDREKVWRCNDGRQGPVPSWSAIQAGGGDVPMMPQPIATAQPGIVLNSLAGQAAAQAGYASGGAPQANAAQLRNQVVQAALAAAQNPASAVRTLQLLQQVSTTSTPVASKPMAALPATQPSAAPARSNPECREALDFISQCQAVGRPPQDAEIDWLVGIREKFRQNRDFTAADEMRNAMRNSLGVELYEKEKKWTCSDGRQGTIPLWNSLNP